MGDVVELDVITKLDIPPERVLKGALEIELESVVIVGHTKDGEYFASSIADGPEVLWMLERAKKAILEIPDDIT